MKWPWKTELERRIEEYEREVAYGRSQDRVTGNMTLRAAVMNLDKRVAELEALDEGVTVKEGS